MGQLGNPRIVMTGAGVAAPLGVGVQAFSDALWRGVSTIWPSPRFAGSFASEFTAFDPTPWLGNKGVRVLDRGTRFLCVAAQTALAASGLAPERQRDAEVGLVCGSIFGGMHSMAEFDWSGLVDGPALVSPLGFANTVINAPAGQAAIKHRLRGVNSTISAGLAAGLCAVDYAAGFLRLGRAEYLMAGGMDEVSEETALRFRAPALASRRGSVQPFGVDRDGTAVGEGAALWMLEREETALARGAKPWLEIAGFGMAHQAQPDSSGTTASDATAQALDEAQIRPEKIACIISGANGSRISDDMEARALRRVFGSHLNMVPVSAPKAAFGEAMGASGALLALIAGCALARQEVPPTAGFLVSDSDLCLSADPQPFTGEFALITAFSCDGNAAALVIRAWQ